MTMASWASFIKAFRDNQELSQKDAAKLLGVSQPTLSRWESGRQVPDMRTRRRIQRLVDAHAGLRGRLVGEVVARSLCAQALLDESLRIRAVSERFAELFDSDAAQLEARSREGPHPLGAVAREALEMALRAGLGRGEMALIECVGQSIGGGGRALFLRQLWIPVIVEGGHLRIRVEVAPLSQDGYRQHLGSGRRVRVISLWPHGREGACRERPVLRRLATF